jgi:hypothetical protein
MAGTLLKEVDILCGCFQSEADAFGREDSLLCDSDRFTLPDVDLLEHGAFRRCKDDLVSEPQEFA